MALGMKVLVILAVASFFGLGMIILPATPETAPAFNCFVTTQECLGATDPTYIMTKIFPGMMPSSYG